MRFTPMAVRRTATAVLAGATLLGGSVAMGASATQQPHGWRSFDGRDWTTFAPKEKEAYVAGFLAGAANAAARSSDTTAIRTTVDSLARAGALQFPFGHMLYVNQLDEFYWWDNHVPIPLYLALSSINQRLRH